MTNSLITYECGCTMQRASLQDHWVREYICGAHKSTITLPPVTPPDVSSFTTPSPRMVLEADVDSWVAWAESERITIPPIVKERLTTVVNPFTPEERNVVIATLAIRQFEVHREKQEVERCYINGETRRIRLEALASESRALASAMKKING